MITENTSEKVLQKYPRHYLKVLKGNYAASESAALCHATVIPAYPITPQTSIIEELSVRVGENIMDATFINMDSEHSAFAAAMGAALAGERVFTATSGQGLFYAHEVLHAIAHLRLPIVICNVGRPSFPWNIWSDQSDSISQRDTGWIQFYGESSQEVLDGIIQSYKISEELNLPVMIVLDAFYQSHTSENIWVPDADLVDEFLPSKKLNGSEIDINKPKSFGGLIPPDSYSNFNHGYWKDVIKVEDLTNKTGKEFKEHFGRDYGTIEGLNINKNTNQILVTLSTITTTVRGVIKSNPEVGLLKIRLFKPFPRKSILELFSNRKVDKDKCKIITVDRNFLGDSEGALMQEMKRALYGENYKLQGIYAGLGGRDIPPATIRNIIETCKTNNDEIIWIDS
jgi:pyruvate/2-oxoacid:ferredoxin oxidoreductase alpha subunit